MADYELFRKRLLGGPMGVEGPTRRPWRLRHAAVPGRVPVEPDFARLAAMMMHSDSEVTRRAYIARARRRRPGGGNFGGGSDGR